MMFDTDGAPLLDVHNYLFPEIALCLTNPNGESVTESAAAALGIDYVARMTVHDTAFAADVNCGLTRCVFPAVSMTISPGVHHANITISSAVAPDFWRIIKLRVQTGSPYKLLPETLPSHLLANRPIGTDGLRIWIVDEAEIASSDLEVLSRNVTMMVEIDGIHHAAQTKIVSANPVVFSDFLVQGISAIVSLPHGETVSATIYFASPGLQTSSSTAVTIWSSCPSNEAIIVPSVLTFDGSWKTFDVSGDQIARLVDIGSSALVANWATQSMTFTNISIVDRCTIRVSYSSTVPSSARSGPATILLADSMEFVVTTSNYIRVQGGDVDLRWGPRNQLRVCDTAGAYMNRVLFTGLTSATQDASGVSIETTNMTITVEASQHTDWQDVTYSQTNIAAVRSWPAFVLRNVTPPALTLSIRVAFSTVQGYISSISRPLTISVHYESSCASMNATSVGATGCTSCPQLGAPNSFCNCTEMTSITLQVDPASINGTIRLDEQWTSMNPSPSFGTLRTAYMFSEDTCGPQCTIAESTDTSKRLENCVSQEMLVADDGTVRQLMVLFTTGKKLQNELLYQLDGLPAASSPQTLRIANISGCSLIAFPSVGSCPNINGPPIEIFGSDFSTDTETVTHVSFVGEDGIEHNCESFTVLSSSLIHCNKYVGWGTNLFVRIQRGNLSTLSQATVSFVPSLVADCPFSTILSKWCGLGSCNPTTGLCSCPHENVTGASCDSCSITNYGTTCSSQCPGVSGPCSGHGICDGVFGSGLCSCSRGWAGAVCNIECAGGALNPCSGNGACSLVDGSCTCYSDSTVGFWVGDSCSACNSSYSGPRCTLPCPLESGVVCSGHGTCSNGICLCHDSCGVACEKSGSECTACPSGYWGPACTDECLGGALNPCSGHGTCDGGMLGTGQCFCDDGYAKADCSTMCPGGPSNEDICSGHGTCDLISATCYCEPYYAGVRCSITCPGYPNNTCSSHGVCQDGSSKLGTCLCDMGYMPTFDCSQECPGGHENPCSGHGFCDALGCTCYAKPVLGFWKGTKCDECIDGWKGPLCNEQCPKANGLICNGHGTCSEALSCQCYSDSGSGRWSGVACEECQTGFFGPLCREECPGGYCNQCSGNGVCHWGLEASGTCTCITSSDLGFWATDSCSDCVEGYYGSACRKLCPRTNGIICGHGTCDDGIDGSGQCICDARWRHLGDICGECASGYYGPNCLSLCPGAPHNACSGKGSCKDGVHGTGTCVCMLGFTERDCSVSCPVAEGSLCGHGACIPPGWCRCDEGWANSTEDGACTICESDYYGTMCQPCPKCVNGNCSSGIEGSGTCNCAAGFWGDVCERQCQTGSDGKICSGNGECRQTDGSCECYRNPYAGYWTGKNCAECQPEYLSENCKTPCPPGENGYVCNGRGDCMNGKCFGCRPLQADDESIVIVCGTACDVFGESCNENTCPRGYFGFGCKNICPGGVDSPCSGEDNGYCLNSGICACKRGSFGKDCSLKCQDNANGICNGNGQCTSSGCVCNFGYAGTSCEIECPGGSQNPCSGNGVCETTGACTCTEGSVGYDCSLSCPGSKSNYCSNLGVCVEVAGGAVCTCFADELNGFHDGAPDCSSCRPGFGGGTCRVKCNLDHSFTSGKKCQCEMGYAGPSCDIVCPGRESGPHKTCSGHGTCNQQGICICEEGSPYYGKNCSVKCSSEMCAAQGKLHASCDKGNGTCVCNASWTGENCDTCETFYYGMNCLLSCRCNSNGGCHRVTGECQCFRDSEHGFWGGQDCSRCAKGYIGLQCRGFNIEISRNIEQTVDVRVEALEKRRTILFSDTIHNITYLGSRPIVMLNTTSSQSQALPGSLDFDAPLRSISLDPTDNHTLIAVTVDEASKDITLYRISRGFPPQFAQAMYVETHAVVRRATTQAEWYDGSEVATLVDPVSGDVIVVITSGGLIFMSAAKNSTQLIQVPNVTIASTADILVLSSGQSLLFVGGSFGGIWSAAYVILPILGDAGDWQVKTQSNTDLPDCTASIGSVCSALDRCAMTIVENFVFAFCGMNSQIGPMLVSFSLSSAYSGAKTVLLLRTHLKVNFTAIAFDSAAQLGYIAYNPPFAPTTLTKFVLQLGELHLAPTGETSFSYFGSEPEVVSSIITRMETRELHAVVVLDFKTRLISLNLFGVKSVSPHIIDSSGNVTVTVTGEGFSPFAPPSCAFASSTVVPGVFDGRRVICRAPEANEQSGDCAVANFNIFFGARRTDTSNVPVLRPLSALVESVVTEHGADYGHILVDTMITVIGFGFVRSPYATCRLRSKTLRTPLYFNATLINSSAVKCMQRAMVTCHNGRCVPTARPSYLDYSHDGQIFSAMHVLYSIVGTASKIAVVKPTGHVVVPSAIVAHIPVILVDVVDENDNSLHQFDDEAGDGPHEAFVNIIHTSKIFTKNSNTSISTVRGTATFDSLALLAPLTGPVQLEFVVRYSLISQNDVWRVPYMLDVVPGVPTKIGFLYPEIPNSWVIFTQREGPLLPNPDMVIIDPAGNAIRDSTSLPEQLYVEYSKSRDNQGTIEDQLVSLHTKVRPDGVYRFDSITVRGKYGTKYDIVFSTDIPTMAPLVRSVPLERCVAGSEYAVEGTFVCARCPQHGVCDGSMSVGVSAGYWRSTLDSYVFYSCRPPYSADSCEGGRCIKNYMGPRCSVCVPGTGKTGLQCLACDSSVVNILLLSLICFALFAVLFLLAINSIPKPNTSGVQQQKSMFVLVMRMFANYLQVSSYVRETYVRPPPILSTQFQIHGAASTFEFNFSYLDCETGNANFFSKFIGVCVAPIVLIVVLNLVVIIWRAVQSSSRSQWDIEQEAEEEAILRDSEKRRQELFEDEEMFDPIAELMRCGSFSETARTLRRTTLTPDNSPFGVNRYNSAHEGNITRKPSLLSPTYPADQLCGANRRTSFTMVGDTTVQSDTIHRGSFRRTGSMLRRTSAQNLEATVRSSGTPKPQTPPPQSKSTSFSALQIMIVTAAVVLFLFYSTVISVCSKMLQCEPLDYGSDGVRDVLIVDRRIDCNTPEYTRFAVLAGFLMLAFGVGLPIFTALTVKIMAKFSFDGDMDQARTLFFFMTGGYIRSLWYWESVVMVRKAVMSFVTVAIEDITLRNYVAFWSTGISLALHVKMKPYEVELLSMLETFGLLTIFISLNVGAMYTYYPESSSPTMYMVLTLFIFSINIVCVGMYILMLGKGAVTKLRKIYEANPDSWRVLGIFFPKDVEVQDKARRFRISAMRNQRQFWKRQLGTWHPRRKIVHDAIHQLQEMLEKRNVGSDARDAIENYFIKLDVVMMLARLGKLEHELLQLYSAEKRVMNLLVEAIRTTQVPLWLAPPPFMRIQANTFDDDDDLIDAQQSGDWGALPGFDIPFEQTVVFDRGSTSQESKSVTPVVHPPELNVETRIDIPEEDENVAKRNTELTFQPTFAQFSQMSISSPIASMGGISLDFFSPSATMPSTQETSGSGIDRRKMSNEETQELAKQDENYGWPTGFSAHMAGETRHSQLSKLDEPPDDDSMFQLLPGLNDKPDMLALSRSSTKSSLKRWPSLRLERKAERIAMQHAERSAKPVDAEGTEEESSKQRADSTKVAKKPETIMKSPTEWQEPNLEDTISALPGVTGTDRRRSSLKRRPSLRLERKVERIATVESQQRREEANEEEFGVLRYSGDFEPRVALPEASGARASENAPVGEFMKSPTEGQEPNLEDTISALPGVTGTDRRRSSLKRRPSLRLERKVERIATVESQQRREEANEEEFGVRRYSSVFEPTDLLSEASGARASENAPVGEFMKSPTEGQEPNLEDTISALPGVTGTDRRRSSLKRRPSLRLERKVERIATVESQQRREEANEEEFGVRRYSSFFEATDLLPEQRSVDDKLDDTTASLSFLRPLGRPPCPPTERKSSELEHHAVQDAEFGWPEGTSALLEAQGTEAEPPFMAPRGGSQSRQLALALADSSDEEVKEPRPVFSRSCRFSGPSDVVPVPPRSPSVRTRAEIRMRRQEMARSVEPIPRPKRTSIGWDLSPLEGPRP